MRLIAIVATALMTSACATPAAPNFFNGQYYMAGDSNCKAMYVNTPTTIECRNSKGESSGYRNAMTATDIQYYYAQRAYQQQQIAQMQATINANNAQIQQNTQQVLQSASSYTPPSVYSPTLGGGYASATCTNAGNYLSCQSELPAANFTCIQAGNFYHCRPRS
jgi:hypothetical protein